MAQLSQPPPPAGNSLANLIDDEGRVINYLGYLSKFEFPLRIVFIILRQFLYQKYP